MPPSATTETIPPSSIPTKSTPLPSQTEDEPPAYSSEPSDDNISHLHLILSNESEPLARRFRALFSLKHNAALNPPNPTTIPSIHAIAAALASPSALLKHELAYCLGQSRKLEAVPFLQNVVRNKGEDAMVRHEAAEALGAIGHGGSLGLLRSLRDTDGEVEVVRETCQIAVERILWEEGKMAKAGIKDSDFSSIDPAPPLARQSQKPPSIPHLQDQLLNTNLHLFHRYRAMFTLRDLASPPDLPTAVPAIQALASGFRDSSALFRHEIAFVFGQLSHPASLPSLVDVLSNRAEESMVRHEAAEALGSLGEEEGVEEVLLRFREDGERVVRESVEVALDMAEFERSGGRDYTDV